MSRNTVIPREQGFSLVELLTVLAVLAAMSLMLATGSVQQSITEVASADELVSALRYSRSRAVATRCPVQVVSNAGGFAITEQSTCNQLAYNASDNFDLPVVHAAFSAKADKNRLQAAAVPDFTLVFDALGRALSDSGTVQDYSLQLANRTLQIAGETGLILVR